MGVFFNGVANAALSFDGVPQSASGHGATDALSPPTSHYGIVSALSDSSFHGPGAAMGSATTNFGVSLIGDGAEMLDPEEARRGMYGKGDFWKDKSIQASGSGIRTAVTPRT